MKMNWKVEVLCREGDEYHLYRRYDVEYKGRYDSEKILKKFFKDFPQYLSDRYFVQIAD